MTSRLYDYIIKVEDASDFRNGNAIIGMSTGTIGYISNVDTSSNNIKVKVNNVYQEFSVNEVVCSNHYLISNTYFTANFTGLNIQDKSTKITLTNDMIPVNISELSVYVDGKYSPRNEWVYDSDASTIGFKDLKLPVVGSVQVVRETGNINSESFVPSQLAIGNSVTSASTSISAIYNSPFIRSKNSFTQAPIVRLLTFYYPGEWYPPNDKGNPTGNGAGLPWPANMPWRIAEIIGDYHSDLLYNVTFDGESYLAYPLDSDGIGTSSDGTIDKISMRVSNFDNIVTNFIENPRLVGNVTSDSTTAYVNGELLRNIDPATVPEYETYDQQIVDTFYGKINSAWSYERAISEGQTWKDLKYDTRDFLGGVVEIKSTLANHLQYWPEYSNLINIELGNTIQVYNSAPYRIGDKVTTATSTTQPIVTNIIDNNILLLSENLESASLQQGLYIINPEYDSEAYIKDVLKIVELTALNDTFAEFSLTSWLQYFKLQLPKRKFYKNTCQWIYKGDECQYPGPGSIAIPGTIPTKYSNSQNVSASNQWGGEDECAKSFEACKVRNNTIHFGAFPGTGRQIPRQ